MSTLMLFIGVIVLAIITYIIIRYVYAKATIQDLSPNTLSLAKPNPVYNSDAVRDNLLTKGGSSFMSFINLRFGDRTQDLGENYQMIFGIKDCIEFQVSPNAARLSVATRGQKVQVETIDLPKFPTQKWIFLAILRDGRRFDIMYDDRIVASQRLDNYPIVLQNPLVIGNSKFLGNAVHVLVAPYRLTPGEVSIQRAKLADTNGEPPAAETSTFGLPPLPFTGLRSECIPGLPCKPITKPPKNNMKAWSTPYN